MDEARNRPEDGLGGSLRCADIGVIHGRRRCEIVSRREVPGGGITQAIPFFIPEVGFDMPILKIQRENSLERLLRY
jgi:hypothetical protein